MKTFLIIVGVIVAIFIIVRIFRKGKLSTVNPINGMNFNGCMGINLGDDWHFVLSRMVHLNLISQQEAKEYIDKYAESNRLGSYIFGETFKSTAKYNNIDTIDFRIDGQGKLEEVVINLVPEQTDMSSLLEICKNTLTQQIGEKPLVIKDEKMYLLAWDSPDRRSIINIDMSRNTIYVAISPSMKYF